ncbi:glypican-5, partial [Pimephales promelas]
MVLRLGRNSTLTLIREEFPTLGTGASGAVTQLFMDMSLYILGSDANVNDMVSTFFSHLFPLTYRRLLGNGAVTGISEECLRGAWRGTSAFGSFPKMMMTRLSRSLLATRVFLQALNLGIEVVNTTSTAGRQGLRALTAEALVLPSLSRPAGGPAVPAAVCQHHGSVSRGSGGGAASLEGIRGGIGITRHCHERGAGHRACCAQTARHYQTGSQTSCGGQKQSQRT